MIPKIIHYCWFGGNPLPPLAQKCIKSWKKYCPDYEIVRWDESNFDINGSLLYVKQAYERRCGLLFQTMLGFGRLLTMAVSIWTPTLNLYGQ